MTFDSAHLAERSRDSDSGDAALKAASLSFSSSSGPALPQRPSATQTNEAFVAANKARFELPYRERTEQLRRTSTDVGPPLPPRPVTAPKDRMNGRPDGISQSPSGIAALLAAEKFSPAYQKSPASNGSELQVNYNASSVRKTQTWTPQDPVLQKRWQYEPPEEEDVKVDSRPLQRLGTLISAFDGGHRRQSLQMDTAPNLRTVHARPEIHSPIPLRPIKPQNVPLTAALLAARNESRMSISSSRDSSSGPAGKSFSLIAAHSVSPDAPLPAYKNNTKPQYRPSNSSHSSAQADSYGPDLKQTASVNISEESVAVTTESENSSLERLPRRSALSPGPQDLAPAPIETADYGAVPSAPSPSPTRLPERLEPSFTGSSMRDALAASSLASSRAVSPASQAILAPPREHQRRGHSISKMLSPPRSTPSPSKGMRTTMRTPIPLQRTGEDSDQPQSRKGLHKKHPNKHKEGDRKRWQETLTEVERRRYEGLWAANRGHLISLTDGIVPNQGPRKAMMNSRYRREDMVLDLVVSDIWARSRLSPDVLAEIWELVNLSAKGMLSKTEFIVGTWLIDQCLKGKKPPSRVSESIWASVESSEELRIRAQGLL